MSNRWNLGGKSNKTHPRRVETTRLSGTDYSEDACQRDDLNAGWASLCHTPEAKIWYVDSSFLKKI